MQIRTILLSLLFIGSVPAAGARVESEWLALGSKHWAPTVVSKSGIGTANAVAEARVTRESIRGWCENWSPGDRGCVEREMASPAARTTYRASADCTRGRIVAADGNSYQLAGRWDHSDIGGGRTRWRDAAGRIVGRDNASGGLGISQQWELLCPERPRAAPPTGRMPSVRFVAGQAVEARYGSGWVRARVDSVQRVRGASGPEFVYNVRLENGLRSQLPARMLREPRRR